MTVVYIILVISFIAAFYVEFMTGWEEGRQLSCEYFKKEIYSFKVGKFAFDCYLLKYFCGTTLPSHTDPVPNGKHYRLNIGWGEANFVCEKYIIARRFGNLTITLFRPDLYKHSLYVFEDTKKLSFGFVIFQK